MATKELRRLRRQARWTEFDSELCEIVRKLVAKSVELPCVLTIDNDAIRWEIRASRGSRAVDRNTPDETFMIKFEIRQSIYTARVSENLGKPIDKKWGD